MSKLQDFSNLLVLLTKTMLFIENPRMLSTTRNKIKCLNKINQLK